MNKTGKKYNNTFLLLNNIFIFRLFLIEIKLFLYQIEKREVFGKNEIFVFFQNFYE